MGTGRAVGVVVGGVLGALAVATPVAAARIVEEWRPGLAETQLGGQLEIDGYDIGGLGFYRIGLDDGSDALAVCVQADIGHSTSADYALEAPATVSAELDYLMWRYAGAGRPPSDEQAAAINVLSWRYAGALRRGGGPVWQGDDVTIDVVGVGRLSEIEAAVQALHDEATARRGPWSLERLAVVDGVATVQLVGPAGAIGGEAVSFTWDSGDPVIAATDDAGVASAPVPAGARTVRASAVGPGPTAALVAAGSQRLVLAGPPARLEVLLELPPPTTISTTATTLPPTTTTTLPPTTTTTLPPSSTSSTTSTTVLPTTSTTTTTAPPSTSSTSSTTTTTTTTVAPSTSTTRPEAPPTLPRTGSAGRDFARVGSVLFAVGAGLILATVRRRRPL